MFGKNVRVISIKHPVFERRLTIAEIASADGPPLKVLKQKFRGRRFRFLPEIGIV
jgi:hypothetical protein